VGGPKATGEENDGMSEEEPLASLKDAYDAAKKTGNRRRIVVLGDLAQTGPIVLDGTGAVSSGYPVLIEGVGVAPQPKTKIERTGGTDGSVLEITNYAKIKFENIEVNGIYNDGNGTTANNRAIRAVGYITDNGVTTVDVAKVDNGEQDTTVVTLGAGAVLTGKTLNNAARGGGISVDQGGKLVMLAGSTVTGCDSPMGAVEVYNSVFDMQGGLITENKGIEGGGVFAGAHSAFTMSGGEISENTASEIGGGVYLGKWNWVNTNPKFTMTGGKINDNTAVLAGGGVFANRSTIFELDGGEIIDNVVTTGGDDGEVGGGGIYATGNYSSSGGDTSLTIKKGRISGNKVLAGGGGGGVTIGKDCNATMSGGEISGNSSNSNDKPAAGGVYLAEVKLDTGYQDYITFSMTGGVISGNTATGDTEAKAQQLYKGQEATIKTETSTTKIGGVDATLDAEGGAAGGNDKVKKIDDTIEVTP
jgi:hypothetical protein